jgi:predicted branched-subunit amino acid permease
VTDRSPAVETARTLFLRGFAAMLPLWLGAIPVGIAYAAAARAAGIGPGTAQLMSLTVFSAAAQLSAVALIASGAAWPLIAGTALALNAQALLLGLAAARQTRSALPARLLAAAFLTDAAYAVTAAGRRFTLAGLLGAGVSMYLAWNLGTALGSVAGGALPSSQRLGLDFVAPLMFLVVLVPLVRGRAALCAVTVAALAAWLLPQLMPAGVAVLGAGLAGSLAGAAWQRREAGKRTGEAITAPRTAEGG